MPIPTNEIYQIDNQLNSELELIKKYKICSAICKNQQLKMELDKVCEEHQNKYDNLINRLN